MTEIGWKSRYFNPRSREGSDLLADSVIGLSVDFNPRSREGSDTYSHGSPAIP